MKLRYGFTIALTLLICTSQVQADDSGFYVGAGFGKSNFDSNIGSLTGTAALDENDTGFKLLLGYEYNSYLSVEGHYADFGQSELTGNNGDTFVLDGTTYAFSANNVSVTSDAKSAGLAAILAYPVTDSIKPYAKLGLHRWDVEGNATSTAGNASTGDDGTDLFFGVGVNVSINDSLSARLEAERFKFDSDDINFISLGFQYKF